MAGICLYETHILMNAATETIEPEAEGKPTARRGRPPLDPEARRQRIIAVASELFIRHGYPETTVEAIGKAAGVTKRTIYELVGDKAALFGAVSAHCHASIKEMRLDFAITGTSLRTTLLDLAHALIEHALSDETIALERAAVLQQMRFPLLMSNLMALTRVDLNGKIAAFFDGLMERGMIGKVDAFKTTEIFFDVVVGNAGFRKALGFDEPAPGREDIEERVDIFIEGHLRRHGLAPS